MTRDPISVASARLFGAGADAQERLLALKFLGVLMERADDKGRVRCDPDDLVGLGLLHGLEPHEVDRSRRWLELVSVLDRRGDAWVIRDFSPVGAEVPPAEAMDAIARALGRPLRTGSQLEPASTVVPLAAAESARRRRRVRVPLVPAGVVAAAAVVLALLLAGPAPLRLPSQTASNVRSRASGGREAAARRSSEASRAPASTPVSPSAAAISPSRAPQSTAAATPEASSPGTSTCPTGEVAAVVERVTQDVEQPPPTSVGTQVSAALPALMRTTVTGVLRNTARAAVTVDPFPVDITFTNSPGATSNTVTVEALTAPVTVPPGGSVPWSVSSDGPPHDPTSTKVEARLGAWRWSDAALAASCPSQAEATAK